MTRQTRSTISLMLCALTLVSGCQPIQPYFFSGGGKNLGTSDLSHYMNVATDIEYTDVDSKRLDEVSGSFSPLTLANAENFDVWDLSLEEVTRITLTNSQVIRQLGGRLTDGGGNIAMMTPQGLQLGAAGAITSFDPALVETGDGTASGNPNSGTGVEAALSAFDAQLDANFNWQENDRPQNFGIADPALGDFFAPLFEQDLHTYSVGLSKITAHGTTFGFRHNTFYDNNNNGSRLQPSDWFTNFEASFSQPLLQGAGTQYNRIAGPFGFQQAAAGGVNFIDGVMIARIRQDITLTDFEAGVRNLMRNVEDTYWELSFAYRDLEARKAGRDSSLETWLRVKALQRVGGVGGEADKEAQARSQYFLFRSQVERSLTSLFRSESRLRYLMGLAATDGRLIRPIDEPTTAKVEFDWPTIHAEALMRKTELRRQKWQIKRRELELIATKNNLMPRLDASGRYRWLGAGDRLFSREGIARPAFADDTGAWDSLVTGDFQEWELGVQFWMPLGFRQGMAGVRHYQLLLARERAVLQDMELEASHELSDAIRDIDHNFGLLQTNFNRRVAAQDEVEAVSAVFDAGRISIVFLLDAQQRRAEAESEYYRSLVDYNRAIMQLHFSKGSLLEYNGVYLAEGPWPGKAQFDALRRARQRNASTFVNYSYTRPNVISQGRFEQFMGHDGTVGVGGQPFEVLDAPFQVEPDLADELPFGEPMPQPGEFPPADDTQGSTPFHVDLASTAFTGDTASASQSMSSPGEPEVATHWEAWAPPEGQPSYHDVNTGNALPNSSSMTSISPTTGNRDHPEQANPFRNFQQGQLPSESNPLRQSESQSRTSATGLHPASGTVR